MIKKLRRKFIFINMTIVMLVLITVLALLCFSSSHRYSIESSNALHRFLESDQKGPSPRMIFPERRDDARMEPFPIFVIELLPDDTIQFLHSSNSEISDILAETAVRKVLEQGTTQGRIPSLSLRYLKDDSHENIRIAFADTTVEESAIQGMIFHSVLILIGSMFVLFVISYFLSNIALKPAQEAWDQQSRFVADASHELKTPITVILANLNILLTHPDSTISKQHKWISNTQEETLRMRKLVDNLLFLTKQEANPFPLQLARLNLSDTLWSCLLPLESLAFEEGITFQQDIQPNLFINADAEQIKQLVIILLDNAFKYAADQKVVSITLNVSQEKVCLSVTNTGPAIPAADLPHLFERFYRSDKSRTRKKDGYGLGLSIAESITKGHHGKIRVTSDVPNGTTFFVFFPAAEPK